MPTERRELITAALALALALVAALASGCNNDLCIRHSDCDPGLVCSAAGACLIPAEPDGGAGEDASSVADAGLDAADAGTDASPDASPDAGIDALIDAPTPRDHLELPPETEPDLSEAGLPHDLTNVRRAP